MSDPVKDFEHALLAQRIASRFVQAKSSPKSEKEWDKVLSKAEEVLHASKGDPGEYRVKQREWMKLNQDYTKWKKTKTAAEKQAEQDAHHYFDGKNYYVDTGFINHVQHVLPGVELKHMGFGEFQLVSREGKVDFDRMRGREFPGQSGRSHQVYDDQGGKLVEKMIQAMEQHGKSEHVFREPHFPPVGRPDLRTGRQARANPDEACPSRDGAPGDPHIYEKGKCVFCGQRQHH
jgi:hypothetical protein